MSESLKERLLARKQPEKGKRLSPDEIAALLERVAYGDTLEKVAAEFHVSLNTVRAHVAKACR